MSYEDYCTESQKILKESRLSVSGTTSASVFSLQGLRAFRLLNSTTAEFNILSKLPDSPKVPPAPFESDISAHIVYKYCRLINTSTFPTYTESNKNDIKEFLSTIPDRPAIAQTGFSAEESQKFQNSHPEPNGCAVLERVLILNQTITDLNLRATPDMYSLFGESLGDIDKTTVENLPIEEFMTTIKNPRNVNEAGTDPFIDNVVMEPYSILFFPFLDLARLNSNFNIAIATNSEEAKIEAMRLLVAKYDRERANNPATQLTPEQIANNEVKKAAANAKRAATIAEKIAIAEAGLTDEERALRAAKRQRDKQARDRKKARDLEIAAQALVERAAPAQPQGTTA
jgi:hypothetical protein